MLRSDTLAAAFVFICLGACAAEVRLQDDDDGDGAAGGVGGRGDGAAVGSTTTSSSATGSATVEAARSELAGACDSICTTRCIGTSAYCERDCTNAIDDCVDEKLAYIRCKQPGSTGPCPEEADPDACEEERDALSGCNNRYRCASGGYGQELVCAPRDEDTCECEAGCNEDHVAVAACHRGDIEVICDCYLDGEHRGECRESGTALNCEWMGCCHPLLR